MKSFYQLMTFIFFSFVLVGEVKANHCLDFSSQSSAYCQATYTYEKQTLYFDSEVIGEQSLNLERISEKASGKIVNVDFFFVGNCEAKGYCNLSFDAFLDLYIDGFRHAIEAEGLYEYVPDICDPRLEVCCDDFQCTEILSLPNTPAKKHTKLDSDSERELLSDPIMTSNARGAMIKRVIDSALDAFGAGIVDRALDGALSNDEFMNETLVGSNFTIVDHNGEKLICAINGFTCETLNGSFSNAGAYFETEDYSDARALHDFLQEYYNHYHVQCWSRMTCDLANSCVVTYYCD